MLLLLAAAATYLTFRGYSLYLDTAKKKAGAFTLFAMLLAGIFLLINTRTGRLISHEDMPDKLPHIVTEIESVHKNRYNSELLFKYEYRPGSSTLGILNYTGNRELHHGSIIAVHKNIRRISAGNNGYLLKLTRQGIHFRGTLDDTEITVLEYGRKTLRRSVQDSVREKIINTFPHPVSALVIAVYFGDTSFLEKRIITQFRDAGTLHLLAASGMNIALAASIPLLLLVPAGVGRRTSLFISALVVALYLFITDMPVSLVRASAMYMFIIAAFFMSRERNSFNALFLAGSIIILLMPWELFDMGFQLSFGATAGILFFYKGYKDSLKDFPEYISKSLAVTFAAQLVAYPIIYIHLNQFNPAGFITNLVEIPLITAITLLSLPVLGISFIHSSIASVPAQIISLLCKSVFLLNEFVTSMKLNFLINDSALIPATVFIISALPLIHHRFFTKMKAYPVFTALLLSALMLKDGRNDLLAAVNKNEAAKGIMLARENDRIRLTLDFDDGPAFNEDSLFLLRKINPDIKIIEISRSTYNNITACRILMNDFIIDECIVNNVESVDAGFTGFLKILHKENIKVTIRYSDSS